MLTVVIGKVRIAPVENLRRRVLDSSLDFLKQRDGLLFALLLEPEP